MIIKQTFTIFVLLFCTASIIVPPLPARAETVPAVVEQEIPAADIDDSDWYMAGANPQRTSWVSEEVQGKLPVEWYRPIEAYIDQKVQIITAYGNLYVSTSRGLYVLNAVSGETVWRYDTELPLGHSPTVINGKVYVGSYDKKLHALDAHTGAKLWEFTGADAGFSVNPLVVEGKVYAGNRDGYFYALNAETGVLHWQYPQTGQAPLGPIKFSAAYENGIIYFASADMHAYALNAGNGSLIWKSAKLLGESFQSWWPVIYRDKVVFSGSPSYRFGTDPGTRSVKTADGLGYGDYGNGIERDDIFPPESKPSKKDTVGPVFEANQQNGPWDWIDGTKVMDGSRITEYLEDDGTVRFDRHTNKPWRRTYFVLNKGDGSEYTFDSDGDGKQEYAPILYYGTKNGNAYPPIVMPDGVIYQNNYHEFRDWIVGGQVTGWKLGTQYLSLAGGASAIDEPQAISGGGNLIYRNLCCDRVGSVIRDVTELESDLGGYWNYSKTLADFAPDYDSMWRIYPGHPRLDGNYVGAYGSVNGLYHNHGDQNPLVPYQGRIYTHRSNAIIAVGPAGGAKELPLLEVRDAEDSVEVPSTDQLQSRLASEVEKMLEAGRLRPGYYNDGMSPYQQLRDYYNNPGDTIYTLAIAYPHLPEDLQPQVKAYLQEEYNVYFKDNLVASIGWNVEGSREYMTLPPEIQDEIQDSNSSKQASGWPWQYPQHNFYALWKYAELFPETANGIYQTVKGKLQVPAGAGDKKLAESPWEHNAYIAGYIGFLNLQALAGQEQTDQALRTTVQEELDRLLALRVDQFAKDTPWTPEGLQDEKGNAFLRRKYNLARNFMFLVPELGAHLREHALDKVEEAWEEYNYVGAFWFVTAYEGSYYEGVKQHLYDPIALFQAKAYILNASQEELYKYLDTPVFRAGDLFYIQSLVALLESAESVSTAAAPQIIPSGGIFDAEEVIVELSTSTPDASIHYTLDGSNPTASSLRYEGPFVLTKTTTVRARTFRDGQSPSKNVAASFLLNSELIYLPVLLR